MRFVIRDGDYHMKNISVWKPDTAGVYAGFLQDNMKEKYAAGMEERIRCLKIRSS